ncbi:NUDIX hydrolase [soil metagenome]
MENREAQAAPAKIQTEQQVSAGGVVVRHRAGEVAQIVLIAVGPQNRWQLPKGLVEPDETPEQAAAREVREETGINGALIAPLEVVEYWYVATRQATRVRFHKFVHFFLFNYGSGDVTQHDHEVNEACWMTFAEARQLLTFASERRVVAQAQTLIEAAHDQ